MLSVIAPQNALHWDIQHNVFPMCNFSKPKNINDKNKFNKWGIPKMWKHNIIGLRLIIKNNLKILSLRDIILTKLLFKFEPEEL